MTTSSTAKKAAATKTTATKTDDTAATTDTASSTKAAKVEREQERNDKLDTDVTPEEAAEDLRAAQEENEPIKDADGDYVYPDGQVAQPLTVPPETYTDSRGVERLSGGFDDGWEPAPLDPDPELVKQQEARQKAIEDKRKERDERLEAIKTDAERDSESASSDSDDSDDDDEDNGKKAS